MGLAGPIVTARWLSMSSVHLLKSRGAAIFFYDFHSDTPLSDNIWCRIFLMEVD